MVYLGPIEPRSTKVTSQAGVAEVRAVSQTGAAHGIGAKAADAVNPAGFVERRKQDRRSNSKSPLVETRAGKDRRKNGAGSISISV